MQVEHQLRAVNAQSGDPDSVLEQYRRFLAFRKQHQALAKGEIRFLTAEDRTLAYERSLGQTTGSWQLAYRLGQRFTLRAKSGEDAGLDLLWLWRFD